MDEPLGIPGHVSHEEPTRRLQEELKRLGISYEAEGEVTRIHLDDVIVEVKDDPEYGYITQVQTPLPTPGEDPKSITKSLEIFASVISRLEGEIHYIVEEFAPGYPMLIGIIPYKDRVKQVEDLLKVLYEHAKAD